jgi:hypothetical protein
MSLGTTTSTGSTVDPISVELLAALAGGAGGEMGKEVWSALSALVRRPFRRDPAPVEGSETELASGVGELVALEQAPHQPARAHALSTALTVRATLDPEFAASLNVWAEQARLVRTGEGDVHNSISGGVQNTVVQGRDFGSLTFIAPESNPESPPPATRA